MFARQLDVPRRPRPQVWASNDNGAPWRPKRRGPAAPEAASILGLAAAISGSIAVRYVADGVFRISRPEGVLP